MQRLIISAGLLFASISSSASENIGFDTMAVNETPTAWVVAMTHEGGAPNWTVLKDATAPSQPNVLAQISNDATNSRYPLAIYAGAKAVDGTVRVKFKTISGKLDQAAGLIWRYQNPDNYYICRANTLENNIVLYKVEAGKRTALVPKGMPPNAYGVQRTIPLSTWSALSVKYHGNLFEVSFNGEKIFDVEDSSFLENGGVGLWTKADSVTHFDDFVFEPLK